MAEHNELTSLKTQLKEAQRQESAARDLAGGQTLDSKQVEVYTVGPRAPASAILGLVSSRNARRTTLAESDPTDPVVMFDMGPNDPVIIVRV
jgi:hypothetical protein